MTVSAGFQRKIEDWMIGEDWSVAFRPFLTNVNPYKAQIMLVGATAQPRVDADESFVELLLQLDAYDEVYSMAQYNRENKGIVAFMKRLEEVAPTVMTSLNPLMVDAAAELKAQKGTNNEKRGQKVFKEVVTEFQPQIMILHGADTIKQFRKQFAEEIIDTYPTLTKPQELEKIGAFATWQLKNKEIHVFACRSLSQYSNGDSFHAFVQQIASFLR